MTAEIFLESGVEDNDTLIVKQLDAFDDLFEDPSLVDMETGGRALGVLKEHADLRDQVSRLNADEFSKFIEGAKSRLAAIPKDSTDPDLYSKAVIESLSDVLGANRDTLQDFSAFERLTIIPGESPVNYLAYREYYSYLLDRLIDGEIVHSDTMGYLKYCEVTVLEPFLETAPEDGEDDDAPDADDDEPETNEAPETEESPTDDPESDESPEKTAEEIEAERVAAEAAEAAEATRLAEEEAAEAARAAEEVEEEQEMGLAVAPDEIQALVAADAHIVLQTTPEKGTFITYSFRKESIPVTAELTVKGIAAWKTRMDKAAHTALLQEKERTGEIDYVKFVEELGHLFETGDWGKMLMAVGFIIAYIGLPDVFGLNEEDEDAPENGKDGPFELAYQVMKYRYGFVEGKKDERTTLLDSSMKDLARCAQAVKASQPLSSLEDKVDSDTLKAMTSFAESADLFAEFIDEIFYSELRHGGKTGFEFTVAANDSVKLSQFLSSNLDAWTTPEE